MLLSELGLNRLYIHYPFCSTRCHYCNFAAGAPPWEEYTNQYYQALKKEVNFYLPYLKGGSILDSLYFGGGTPSLMPLDHLEDILYLLQDIIGGQTEITLEVNPENVSIERVRAWKQLGINRVSLGWQSMNDRTLKFLGRSGDSSHNWSAFEMLRAEGFDNISVDRILSVQDDTDQDYLDAVKKLMPDHISTYQLSIEDNTVLKYWSKTKYYTPVPDEKALHIEKYTEEVLLPLNFIRYETSNYHRNGKLGRHNLGYWNYDFWLGLGSGASGFLPVTNSDPNVYGIRYQNPFSFKDYIKTMTEKIIGTPEHSEFIDISTAIREALMLGIRKREGIEKKIFENKLYVSWDNLFLDVPDPKFFTETDSHLILNHDAIPYTNPAIVSLWENLV